MIRCQRCPPEDGIFADTLVREKDADTGREIRVWYLCAVHLEEDFGPWLRIRRAKSK